MMIVPRNRLCAFLALFLCLSATLRVNGFSSPATVRPVGLGTVRAPSYVRAPSSSRLVVTLSAKWSNPLTRRCWGRRNTTASMSSDDMEIKDASHWGSSFLRGRKPLAVAAAIIGTVALCSSPCIAASSGVADNANTLAQSTSVLLESLSQTGFYQAFSLVFLSEIGDKTFFIAGLLSMKTSRFISFIGSMGALAAMTIVSVVIGQVFHAVPSGVTNAIPLDDIAAVLAFAFFGIKTLKDAIEMDPEESIMDEELAEAEETVEGSDAAKLASAWAQVLSIFGLVFAAEFGDRSFLSTIALSAAQNPISVAGGAIAAHAAATGIAVSGGSVLAKYISEKVIGYIGGTLFLVFAVTTALGIF